MKLTKHQIDGILTEARNIIKLHGIQKKATFIDNSHSIESYFYLAQAKIDSIPFDIALKTDIGAVICFKVALTHILNHQAFNLDTLSTEQNSIFATVLLKLFLLVWQANHLKDNDAFLDFAKANITDIITLLFNEGYDLNAVNNTGEKLDETGKLEISKGKSKLVIPQLNVRPSILIKTNREAISLHQPSSDLLEKQEVTDDSNNNSEQDNKASFDIDERASILPGTTSHDTTTRDSIVERYSVEQRKTSKQQQLKVISTYEDSVLTRASTHKTSDTDISLAPILQFMIEDTTRRSGYWFLHPRFLKELEHDLTKEQGEESRRDKATTYLIVYMELRDRIINPSANTLKQLLTDKQIDHLTRPGNYLGQMECFEHIVRSRFTFSYNAQRVLNNQHVTMITTLLKNTVSIITNKTYINTILTSFQWSNECIDHQEKTNTLLSWSFTTQQKFVLMMVLIYAHKTLCPINQKIGVIVNSIFNQLNVIKMGRLNNASEADKAMDIHQLDFSGKNKTNQQHITHHVAHCIIFDAKATFFSANCTHPMYRKISTEQVTNPSAINDALPRIPREINFKLFDDNLAVTSFDEQLLTNNITQKIAC